MANAHYSFAIVGAGPAGATCANALLLGGATSCVLIDKARFPRDKPCGDGLGPGVIAILDDLGMPDILSGHLRVTQMSMTGPLGGRLLLDTTLLRRRSPLGYVIPRRSFDYALLTAALGRGGADMTGWSLETAVPLDRRWQLKLAHSETGESRVVTADVLIGADGAASKVRRVLGRRLNRDEHSSIALRVYARAKPECSARQQQDIVKGLPPPGYGWVFSTGKEVVNVGWASTFRLTSPRRFICIRSSPSTGPLSQIRWRTMNKVAGRQFCRSLQKCHNWPFQPRMRLSSATRRR